MKNGRPLVATMTLIGMLSCADRDAGLGEIPPDVQSVKKRTISVLVEGCSLDEAQESTLQSVHTRNVVSEVVLHCFTLRSNGEVAPADSQAVATYQSTVSNLKSLGYRVSVALSANDDIDHPYNATRMKAIFQPAMASAYVEQIMARMGKVDAIDLGFAEVPETERTNFESFVRLLSQNVRPEKKLYMMIPPSTRVPSDIANADAYRVAMLAPNVDMFRVMSLDYTCCNGDSGPTTDSGWVTDAYRFASQQATKSAFQVALPLYGYDFSQGKQRGIGFSEALGLAGSFGATWWRGPTSTYRSGFVDFFGHPHVLWIDDSVSLLRALKAMEAPVIPDHVGVLFYGLGAEEPRFFRVLSQVMR